MKKRIKQFIEEWFTFYGFIIALLPVLLVLAILGIVGWQFPIIYFFFLLLVSTPHFWCSF